MCKCFGRDRHPYDTFPLRFGPRTDHHSSASMETDDYWTTEVLKVTSGTLWLTLTLMWAAVLGQADSKDEPAHRGFQRGPEKWEPTSHWRLQELPKWSCPSGPALPSSSIPAETRTFHLLLLWKQSIYTPLGNLLGQPYPCWVQAWTKQNKSAWLGCWERLVSSHMASLVPHITGRRKLL